MSERTDATPVGNLGQTLRRGAMISAGALIVVQLILLAQTLALARILSPAEVGIFAAGTVLSGFLLTFSEGGLRNALVQRQHGLEDAANTVFWASLCGGLLWALAAAAAAPLVAWTFDSPPAGMVAAVSAGTILLHALTNVPDSLMQRRFDFRQRVVVRPSVVISFAVASVTLCAMGFGVWGLVIGSYISHVVWILTTWVLARWAPGRGRPSMRVWREMATFGVPLVLGTVVDKGRDVFETVVVGSALSTTALGHYRYGRRLAMVPSTVVIEVGSYVLFPAFSRIAGDAVRLKSAFLRALRALWCMAAPVAGFIIAVGEPAIVLLLGEPWRPAGVMFVALAGSGPGVAMAAVGFESIKGCGRTSLLNWVTGLGTVVGVGLLLALLPLGLVGVGLALSITSFLSGLVGLLLARGLVGVSLRELVDRLVPPLAATALAAVGIGLVEHLVSHSDQRGIALGLVIVLCEGLGFLAIYLGTLRVIAPATLTELWAAVRRMRDSEQQTVAVS
ncbi:MAG: oligosaccharide flippase family protein [Pseudonocardiaceae bacterium]|nr:oligosaccharide flippase family protein [Pseudonocardiaceae bacterium]